MENQLRFYQQDFIAWLEALNYSEYSINQAKLAVSQLNEFLESKDINHPTGISAMHLHKFFEYLKLRTNRRRGGGLSPSYINKLNGSLRLYQKFLQLNHRIYLPLTQNYFRGLKTEVEVLTVDEVKSLYNACDMSQPIGYRDRAILALYYGVGLRRSEGINLTMEDVKLEERIIHVRESKNRRERFVPMAMKVYQDLKDYTLIARPIMKMEKTNQFLLSTKGKALSKFSVLPRIKALQELSEEDSIHFKDVNVHTLRHSLGTHLLQNGMSIERISRILGHSSITTTQIYTHLIDKL